MAVHPAVDAYLDKLERESHRLEPLADAFVNLTQKRIRVKVAMRDDDFIELEPEATPLSVRVAPPDGIGSVPCSLVVDDELRVAALSVRSPARECGLDGSLAALERRRVRGIVVSARVARYLESLDHASLDALTESLGLAPPADDEQRISVYSPDTASDSFDRKRGFVRHLNQYHVHL